MNPVQNRSAVADALRFWLKTSRPGFWTTAAWFYMLPVGQRQVFGSGAFWLGLLYVTFPLGFLMYGWNDLGDQETDRLNPRKDTILFGARGTPEQLARLPRMIALVQVPFLALFVAWIGWLAVVWFGGVLLANALYNWPGHAFKSHPPLDVLNQAGYLLVFVLSSLLNAVPQLPWQTFVFGLLFAMHSHLFGEIMDIVPDARAGRRTTAAVLGIRAAKALLIVFLLAESAFVFFCFRNTILSGFLAMGALWFTFDLFMLFGARSYPQWLVRTFGIGLNLAAVCSVWWVWSSGCLVNLPSGTEAMLPARQSRGL